MPRQRQPVRPLDVDVELGGAGAAGIERQRHRGALLGGELYRGGGIAGDLHRAGGLDVDGVVAGRALDIVEVEAHGAVVAIEQEARQVAVSTTGSRTVTSVVARPSLVAVHATAITRAVPANSGISKLISAVPSAADRDDAGIQRQRLLRRRAALQLGAGGIAAGLDLAAGALHAVDQLPIEVADFRASGGAGRDNNHPAPAACNWSG